jgi:hypothetical protein
MLLVLFSGMLSACSARGCPADRGAGAMNLNALETSALYNQSPRAIPPDAWTENPGLELFLREALASDGVSSFAKYGMQCTLRLEEDGCKDCFACTKSFRNYALGVAAFSYTCEDVGEISMQVEIGPGARIRAMTYWTTTALAREKMKKYGVKGL